MAPRTPAKTPEPEAEPVADEAPAPASEPEPDVLHPAASINERIVWVIKHLPAIPKSQVMNAKGGPTYNYRGVEQIKAELKSLMTTAGIHYAPQAIEDAAFESYPVGSGAIWQRARLKVRFRFYGPNSVDGTIDAVTLGEGADNGDKASNKAMTAAEKYALIQVFCISDAGADDPDNERPPEQYAPGQTQQQEGPPLPLPIAGVKGALVTDVFGGDKALAKEWWELEDRGSGPFPVAQAEAWKLEARTWLSIRPDGSTPEPEQQPLPDAPPAEPTSHEEMDAAQDELDRLAVEAAFNIDPEADQSGGY